MDLLTRRTLFLIFVIACVSVFLYAGCHLKWSQLFSPGPLSSAHEELDANGDCAACHTRGKRLDTRKCLDCHQEIKTMIQAKTGFHSRVSWECEHCHSEHHGRSYRIAHIDPKTFDHALTGWPIEGSHDLLKCEACHKKGSYLLDKNQCIHCHRDVHEGENGTDCTECHNQRTFRETR
ncbi:MAG: hypothetical protein AB1847_16940 [bacterium]